jgi:diguanylate cyclase (GGDEF)-like protein/PAS domain S-box-containing protein
MRPVLRQLAAVETIVAIAIAATVLAIAYREPLTRQTLELSPGDEGKRYFGYTFDDRAEGGTSVSDYRAGDPLAWTCTLRSTYQWPYCGFGVTFEVLGKGRGLDLSGYQHIDLRLRYHGPRSQIRFVLKDHDPRYQSLPTAQDKVNQANFEVSEGAQDIALTLDDLAVADRWKDATNAPVELARPSFHNILTMEILSGADGKLGRQAFRIDRITFERQLVSTETWYAGIAIAWMVLIGSLLLYRRRHIAGIKRSAAVSLRESERLYRTILETSTDCIILFNTDGQFEFVNSAGLRALELPPIEEIRGRHWTEFWDGKVGVAIGDAIRRALAGESARLYGPGPTAKGTQRWWDAVTLPVFDECGAMKGVLSVSRDVTVERERSEQLKWASEHDALTELPNRRAFQSRLQAATLRAMEGGEKVGLLLIDLDHFKYVNDSLGHSAGDDLLKAVAKRLRKGVREGDFVARIGGDEFAIVLEHLASPEVLLSVGKQLLSSLNGPMRAGSRAVRAGASIGGALFPENASTADDLFKSADTALYALKHDGRGGTRLFDSYMLHEAERSASQLRVARGAVTDRTVVPVYQPKFDIGNATLVGFEALLRWRDPRRGLQLPATLEEAFADYELAAKIGELMQRKVAADVRHWIDSGLELGRVAINAAPAEFLRDDYAEHFLSVLAENDLSPGRFEVEVTEHAFVGRANEYVARALTVLKAANVSVSLDDFGTGSSSLSHLRDFRVDIVKIDRSFIQQMTEDDEIAAIVTAVVRLARSLSIDVIAEGVETLAQVDLLRAMGCHMAQGHFFSAALEADAVTSLVQGDRAAAA